MTLSRLRNWRARLEAGSHWLQFSRSEILHGLEQNSTWRESILQNVYFSSDCNYLPVHHHTPLPPVPEVVVLQDVFELDAEVSPVQGRVDVEMD